MSAPTDSGKNHINSALTADPDTSPIASRKESPISPVQYLDPKAQSRRDFLQGTGTAVVASAALGSIGFDSAEAASADAAVAINTALTPLSLTVNGRSQQLQVDPRWTLVEVLRDQLDLTGTKIGCDRSECGACTVLLNGKPVYSCSQLAVWADGMDVQTVEGLAQAGRLSPLQQAFVDNNGPQCGFCTSGQLMTATALLASNPVPDAIQVRQALVGNLCRCSNYMAIVEAVVATGAATGTVTGSASGVAFVAPSGTHNGGRI